MPRKSSKARPVQHKDSGTAVQDSSVQLWYDTPLLPSSAFLHLRPMKIYFKLDNTQECGSFKGRGLGNFCQKAIKRGAKGFVIASGGNAAMACCIACRKLNVPLDVFVPETTPNFVLELFKAQGAVVHTAGRQWIDSYKAAQAWQAEHPEEKREMGHPYDHPDIWEGNATIVDELHRQMMGQPPPDAIVVAVGGGGLMNGVVQGLQKYGWTKTKVITMETEGAHCLYLSRANNKRTEMPQITSIATTLGVNWVSERTWQLVQEWPVLSFTCTDAQAVMSAEKFLADHRMVVEPSCGAALSAVYFGVVENLVKQGELRADATVVVVVCGGVLTSVELLNKWKKSLNDKKEE